MVVLLQIVTIVLSRGDVFVLGEACVRRRVSFAFKALAMLVLRSLKRRPARVARADESKIGGVRFLSARPDYAGAVRRRVHQHLLKKTADPRGEFTLVLYAAFGDFGESHGKPSPPSVRGTHRSLSADARGDVGLSS
jgi:hypothetical protein